VGELMIALGYYLPAVAASVDGTLVRSPRY
jgi:hypothetical protein